MTAIPTWLLWALIALWAFEIVERITLIGYRLTYTKKSAILTAITNTALIAILLSWMLVL